MRTIFWITIGAICVIAIAFLAWYSLELSRSQATTNSNSGIYSTLISTNPDFVQADAAYRAGNYQQAYTEYQLALATTQDPQLQGNIKLKMAYSYEYMDNDANYLAAMPLFEAVATDTQYAPINRAYAVQELAQMYYQYSDPKVTSAVFSQAPYASMYVPNSISLSYRHVYEYAASLYPLAVSELRIADWYSSEVSRLSVSTTSATTSAATIATDKSIITQDLAAANKDIVRITGTAEASQLPIALLREAIVVARLAATGDTSFGDWESLFKQDIALDATGSPGEDGYARYYYADFLALIYGNSRQADIESILSPIYSSDQYVNAPVTRFFKGERNDTLGAKPALIRLAAIDPDFKTYLITLGWQQSDFSTPS